jgi:hypothetical protein
MLEPEARSLKVGDKVAYILEGLPVMPGVVTAVNWACFQIMWDDGYASIVNYNEAHYIFRGNDAH